jgi:hypothetical protein
VLAIPQRRHAPALAASAVDGRRDGPHAPIPHARVDEDRHAGHLLEALLEKPVQGSGGGFGNSV